MSVIVKGMEMPNTCEECQESCEIGSNLFCLVVNDGNKFGWKKSENGFESRPNWCPLVPLPEKHGRLIDADAMKRVWMGARIDGDIGVLLDARPTIVEAEGDG
jgi:hypothetical protein